MDPNARTLPTEASALRWKSSHQMRRNFEPLLSLHFDDTIQQLAELRQTNTRLAAEISQQRLLLAEANHRAKNMLGLVQAIVSQTLRRATSTAEASEALSARIAALGDAQNMLMGASRLGAGLREIVHAAMASHGGVSRTSRIQARGPAVRLDERQTLALSLALHELATNATKHGALSGETGRVEIAWRVARPPNGRRLHLRWSEHDGPPVATPSLIGFGTKLIRQVLAGSLGGDVALLYEGKGFVCTVEAPLPSVASCRL